MPLVDLGPAEETSNLVDLGPAEQTQYNPIEADKENAKIYDTALQDNIPQDWAAFEQNMLKQKNMDGFEPNQIEGVTSKKVQVEWKPNPITRDNTPENKANAIENAMHSAPALARIGIMAAVKLDPFNFKRFVVEKINPQFFSGVAGESGKEMVFSAEDFYRGFDQFQKNLSFLDPVKYAGIVGNAGKVVSEFAVLPGKAATIPMTAVKFGLQSAVQAPVGEESKLSMSEFLQERAKQTAVGMATGLAVGGAGKYIPNPFVRIPAITGGFVTLTGIETGGDVNAMIETGITILGFEAVGLAKDGKYKEAAEKAKEVNPELSNANTEQLANRIEDFSMMMTPGEKVVEKPVQSHESQLLDYIQKATEIPGNPERTKPLSKNAMMEKFANPRPLKDLQDEFNQFVQQERYTELVEKVNSGDKRAAKELNDYVQGLKLPTYEELLVRVNNGDKEALKLIDDGNYYGGPNPKPELAVPKQKIESAKQRKTANDPTISQGSPVKQPAEPPVTPNVPGVTETTSAGPRPPETSVGVISTTPSRQAQRVEEAAIEAKLTESLGDLAGYEKKPGMMKEQAQLAQIEMDRDYDAAKRMALGEIKPRNKDLLPASIFEAVKYRATKEGDVETLRKLAMPSSTSIPSRLSRMGQEIKAADVKAYDGPVEAIQDVIKTREETVSKRDKIDLKTEKSKGKEEIKREIKKAVSRPNWEQFIKSLEC